jgi:preprotein translocase subunit SecE
MRRIITYFKQVTTEAKKVSWPTKEQTYNLTFVVVVASLIVALYIGVLDFVFQKFITFIL